MSSKIHTLLFLAFCVLELAANSEKNESTFVPSREWQPVKKGQPIPSGIHVRHNFKTGVTEAKLLDEESDSEDERANPRSNSLTLHPDESLRRSEQDSLPKSDPKGAAEMKITLEELKARLKKIKLLDNEVPEWTSANSETESSERFKSYDTLKNELKALEVNVTTDAEMLATFFERFAARKASLTAESLLPSVTQDVLQILIDMEYLLHHIDNAQTFADMEGMSKIVSPCLNTTNDEIKAEALRLLGTAVQSNPKVQARALEHDFVRKLLNILATSNRVPLQSRCMFALSALTRHYPAAQKALLDHGGLEIFSKILEDGHLQTQSRVMKLVSDYVVERRDLDEIEDEQLRGRKIREYWTMDFDIKLHVHGYCKHLSNLMIRSFSNEAFSNSNMEDYDFLTVTLNSMILLGDTCKRDLKEEKYSILAIINEALRHYESVRDANITEDDYAFSHLVLLLVQLRTRLRSSESSHVEL